MKAGQAGVWSIKSQLNPLKLIQFGGATKPGPCVRHEARRYVSHACTPWPRILVHVKAEIHGL